MKKGSQNTSIRVFCRLRPLNKLEMSQGGECCVDYTEKNIKIKVAGEEKPHDFAFDGIFGPETAQVEVFNKVAKPVIDRLMEGYNGTLFAYGQTSSGKTFTMEGPDIIDSDDKKGIIPRMMSHLFNLILNSSENIEFNVKVSFLELYNEKLQDLLDPRKNNLQIKEDKNKGIFIQDATEIYVASAEQMRQVHKSGSDNRTVAATRMNERSSRSHSIFVLQVIQRDIKTEAAKSSKLYFVDLAGSEKISKTNVTGQQLEEAKNINKSLTTLGMVINALTEKDKSHIPYRDSKLTRLLQESLGGNSQTSLVLACSMCSYNDKETLGTLRFGNRAKSVKNAPVVNVERSVKELTILLEAAEKKIREQDDIIQSLQQQMDTGVVSAHTSFLEPVPTNMERVEAMLETVEEKPETPVLTAAQSFSFQSANLLPAGEEKIPPRHERHQSKASIDAGAGSASLTLLKQHIQIVNLTEELQALKLTHKELENELSNKTQECYDLIGKTMQYENQIQELTAKTFTKNEEYQVKMEKLCNENQTNGVLMNKFKRAINRLKSDLNFAFISKNLKMLEGDDRFNRSSIIDESQDFQNKEDLIVNSIQKTIEMLEEIEKDLDEREEKPSYMNEVEEIMESFGINKNQKARRSTITKQNEPGSGNSKTNPAESVTTGTDEEIKATTIATEESGGDTTAREHIITENFDNIKIEFESEDDLMQRIQLQSLTEEEKISELQNLITSQRKTINNLSKMNNELTHANHKHQTSQDKKIQSYKIKIEDLQKFNAEKAKEYERKIQSLKTLLEDKIKEHEETKKKQDEDLLGKAKLLSDLKFQNERMQKIILGNDLAKRVFELETKVKEFALERQKLFEDLFKLRGEVDEKDELVTDKNAQIQILQVGLNTLSSELEILKHLRPQQGQNPMIKKDKKEGDFFDGKGSQKNKKEKDKVFFDKHVVKPIRGGGGNVKNFERDNYLIFEKPSMLESSDLRSNPRNAERSGRHDVGSSADSRLGKDNFKKFDEIMKKKDGDWKPRGKSPIAIRTTMEEEEDEPNIEVVKEKLKVYSTKHKDEGQKKSKGFFSGVKNLFS